MILAGVLQVLRNIHGRLRISSAYRCEKKNKEVGGAKRSYHLKGLAADIVWSDWSKEKKVNFMKDCTDMDIWTKMYKDHIHIDLRNYEARY